MGFKAPKKVFRLTFEDSDYAGLVVLVRAASVGDMLDVQEIQDSVEGGMTSQVAADTFEMFAKALVEWNLTDDDDQPVPTTLDGLRGLDVDFLAFIIRAWAAQQTGIPGPLAEGSTSGATSPALSIPMEPLPTSRAS